MNDTCCGNICSRIMRRSTLRSLRSNLCHVSFLCCSCLLIRHLSQDCRPHVTPLRSQANISAAGMWMQLFLSQMGITLCVLARTEARGCLRKIAELWRAHARAGGHSLHAQRARMSLSCACGCWHNYGIAYSLVNVEKTRRSFDLQFYWCSHHGGPMTCLRL